MKLDLPLERMTPSEKLRIIEEIWETLSDKPENVPSPAWHAHVLKARHDSVLKGESKFEDWDEAKRKLRNRGR